jgi:hypothetical protein
MQDSAVRKHRLCEKSAASGVSERRRARLPATIALRASTKGVAENPFGGMAALMRKER